MGKLIALLALFRAGNAVADSRALVTGALTVSLVLPVIVALARLARAYGYEVNVSDADAAEIAGGVVALVNCVVHVVTNEHIGIGHANRDAMASAPAAVPPPRSDEACAPEGAPPQVLPNEPQRTDPFADHGS